MIGRLESIVLDCPDAEALAHFYEKLLGLHRHKTQDGWIESKNSEVHLSFQQVEGDYTPPEWPGQKVPQQFHLDIRVEDVEDAQEKVLALGATKLPGDGGDFRVYADPAGHPFCLVFHPAE